MRKKQTKEYKAAYYRAHKDTWAEKYRSNAKSAALKKMTDEEIKAEINRLFERLEAEKEKTARKTAELNAELERRSASDV